MKTKRIIWQDIDVDPKDYEDYLEENHPDATDSEKYEICVELNEGYLEDERANLNIPVPEGIITIADLGLWNGRKRGYLRFDHQNISDCLVPRCDGMSSNEFFVDGRWNLRHTEIHHDGTNHYLYRAWKPGITDTQKDALRVALYENSKSVDRMISRYTKPLGKEIANVYGWS